MTTPVYIEHGTPPKETPPPTPPNTAPSFVFFLGIVGYAMTIFGLLVLRGQFQLGTELSDNVNYGFYLVFFGSSTIVAGVVRNLYVKSVHFAITQAIILFVLFLVVVVFA